MAAASATPSGHVEVTLVSDTIYGDAALAVRAVGERRFGLVLESGTLVGVDTGWESTQVRGTPRIEAVESAGQWVVEATVADWIAWHVVPHAAGRGAPPVEYSQRFFPYVSSAVSGRLSVEGASLRALGLRLTGGARPLRYHDYVAEDLDGNAGRPAFARAGDGWTWRFSWDAAESASGARFRLPVTTGAPALAGMVGVVAYTTLLAVPGLAAVAAAAPRQAVVGVVLAGIAALLARWATIDRPHHLTALAAIYVVASLLLAGWGVAVEAGGWWFATGVAPVGYAFALLALNVYFEAVGALPSRLAVAWARVSRRLHESRVGRRKRIRDRWLSRHRHKLRPGGESAQEFLTDMHARADRRR